MTRRYIRREWLVVALFIAFVASCSVLPFIGAAHGAEPSRTREVLQNLARAEGDRDEPADVRNERLDDFELAIDGATRDRFERAALIVMAREESHLARFVDLDWPKCREGQGGWCDRGRAWSVWQLHDTDRTGDRVWAAREALRRLRSHGAHCARLRPEWPRTNDSAVYWAGAFASYGTGYTCTTASGNARALATLEIAGRL